MYAIKYRDGKIADEKIIEVRDALKRGLWRFKLDDPDFTPQVVTLDNGMSMDLGNTHRLITEKKEFEY